MILLIDFVCIRRHSVKMTSNATEGIGQPTTAVTFTAAAGGPATNENRFDPFLPTVEPAVEESSLQQSMDANKECKFSLHLLKLCCYQTH